MESICLGGGGVWGFAMVGAIKELFSEEKTADFIARGEADRVENDDLNLKSYIEIIAGLLNDTCTKAHINTKLFKKIIVIKIDGISPTNFNLSESDKKDLVLRGIQGTKNYLRKIRESD